MNMGMIKAALLFRSAIPPQYQRVEYIRNLSNQYLNTNYKPVADTKIELIFDTSESVNQSGAIYGSWNEHTTSRFNGWNNADSTISFGFGNENGTSLKIRVSGKTKMIHYAEKVGNLYKAISSTAENTVSKEGVIFVSPNFDLYIFARNKNGNLEQNSNVKMKLYSFKIFEQDILIHNYIPCRRKSDNKPGMWDTVSKSFLTNAGYNEFILGPDVI